MTQLLALERPSQTPLTLHGAIIIPPGILDPCDEDTLHRISADNPGWKFEIGCDGELVINMHSGGDSGDLSIELGRQIGNWRVSGGGHGTASSSRGRLRDAETGYWLGGGLRVPPLMQPDVSWVSPDQIAPLTKEQMQGAYPLCPAFVVEVRSPTDKLEDQQDKMLLWLDHGARLGWLVDPIEETVWIYRPDREPERLDRPDSLSGEDVLVGLDVDMAEVWSLVDESKNKTPAE